MVLFTRNTLFFFIRSLFPGFVRVWMACCFALLANVVFAEGSKELNANGGNRAYLKSTTSSGSGIYFPTQGLVRVFVNAGEYIYVGSSAQGVYGGKVVLVSPSGNITQNLATDNLTGLIKNRAQEVAGPLPGSGGFTPYRIPTASTETGVWSIYFIGSTSNTVPYRADLGYSPILTTANWRTASDGTVTADNSGDIAAFDVSVSASAAPTTSADFIKGRAYMNVFHGNISDYDGVFRGVFQVLTNDGYTYNVDNNGMAGFQFTFFSNNKGYKSGGVASYKSENGSGTGNLHDPRAVDGAGAGADITHKLFFNVPDPALPATADIQTTNGQAVDPGRSISSTWLKTTAVFPVISNFTFTGEEGTANQAGANPLSGIIGFQSNQAGSYTVFIDTDNNGPDPGDVTINGLSVVGLNKVVWNGKDANGNVVNTTLNPSSITVSLKAGEVHFPFIDVENNTDGIIITRAGGGGGNTTVYWDDSNINYSVANDTPPNPIAALTGVNSATNGHKWGSTDFDEDFGNDNGLDTWTYLQGVPIASTSPVLLLQANLEAVSVQSDKTSYCLGDPITYTVKFENHGPDNISGAIAEFNFPSEVTLNGAPTFATTGVTVNNTAITTTKVSLTLDMLNQGTITVTIQGTVTSLPSSGLLQTKATILRPADVYDPDATDPTNLGPPSDPQLECDGGTNGCNNIVSQSATAAVRDIAVTGTTATITEGNVTGGTNDMVFNVTLSAPNTGCAVTVDYNLIHGTTNANDFDFSGAFPQNGTLTFSPGSTSQNIIFKVKQDRFVEANETFTVQLSNPSSGGTIVTPTAAGTINNDDIISNITITKTDGQEGVQNGSFTFSFPPGLSFDVPTVIPFTLNTGSSTALGGGTDYTPSHTVNITIPAGQNSVTVDLAVIDDGLTEGTETVEITPGTITNTYGTLTVANPIPVLNIIDDDTSTLTISSPTITEGDSGTQDLTFNVTLNNPTGNSFTVNYATANGTALAGEDYVSKTGTLSFSGVPETQAINIKINGDLKIELDEAFQMILNALSNTFGGNLTISGSPATGTVLDNDNTNSNKVITITKADGNEQGPVPGTFTFSFPAGVTADQATTINLGLTGTAANGTDYTGGALSVLIPAGANSATLTLTVVDDAIIENPETVTLTTGAVANSTYNGIVVNNSPQTITIADNDLATLTISDASVTEGDNGTVNLIFNVTLNNATGADFTIPYTTADGTATISNNDYSAPAGNTLTFTDAGPFPQTRQIIVAVNGDRTIEANETLTATLGLPSNTFGGRLTVTGSSGTSATGTINDDDNTVANKTITITKGDGYEGVPGSKATFTFSFPAGVTVNSDTQIPYTLSGTATSSGTDYTGTATGTVTIPAGASSVTLELPVVDDVLIEGNETVIVTTGTVTNVDYNGFTVNNSGLSLTIVDDEGNALLSSPASIVEGNTGTRTIQFAVSGATATSGPFTMDSHTSNGTAIAGVDYVAQTGTLHFAASSPGQVQYIDVVINSDLKIENDETFTITLDNLSDNFGGILQLSPPVTMTIIDDDNTAGNKLITIAKTDGSENGIDGIFTFSFPPGVTADAPTTINYSLTGLAQGAGVDYSDPNAGVIVIPAGQNSVSINLPVVDDTIVEGPEPVILTIFSISNPSYAALAAANSPLPLDIQDNDNIAANTQVTLTRTAHGSEPNTNAQFRVSFPPGITASVPTTVNYSIAGTAINGTDYTTLTGSVTILPNQNFAVIDVLVADDQVIEPTETVELTLTTATNTISALTVSAGAVSANITDDDNTPVNDVVTLARVTDGAEPSTNGQFKVSLPVGFTSSVDTEVSYTVGGTALAGTDYTALSGQVTIPAGSNSITIDVPVIDDQIIEPTETVELTLTTVTNTVAALTVQPSVAVAVTIADNDNIPANNIITLTAVTDGAEPAVNGRFRVSYPAGISSSEPTQVTYTIAGTATNGTDYATLTGVITIPANTNSVPLDVIVTDDLIIEATETVEVTLTAATATGLVPTVDGTPATLNIIDNDNATPNNRLILAWVADGAEPGTNARFTIGFPNGYTSSEPTTVQYVVGGNAQAGVDYTALTGTLVIPANTNSVPIVATVIDDQVIEGTEQLTLTITNAVNSVIPILDVLPVTPVSANIADDDSAVPGNNVITLTATDGSEPGTNPRFRISYPAGFNSSVPTTVTYTVAGTALAGTDYTTLTGTATIPANTNFFLIDVPVIDDHIIEPTETVILTLTNANNALSALTWTPGPVTANLADDDNVLANNTIILTKTADGAEPGTPARFRVAYPAGYVSAVATTVNYTVSGTAAAGLDYTALPGTITIPANTNSVLIDVPVLDDQIIEATETVELTLNSANSSVSVFALQPDGSAVSADIADNDNITANKQISLTLVRNGAEGGADPQFRVSFPAGYTSSAATTVTYTVTGASTAIAGVDYAALTGSVTIPANSNFALIDVPVINDLLIEPTETVVVSLTGAANAIAPNISTQIAAVSSNIADDDNIAANTVITLTKVSDGAEPSSAVRYTVGYPAGYTSAVATTVTYTITGGTAVQGTDYATVSGAVTIPANTNSATIDIAIIDDTVIEETETLRLKLANASSTISPTLSVNTTVIPADITDDDNTAANRTITITKADGAEGGVGARFIFTLPAGVTFDKDVTVPFLLSGQAVNGTDYATAPVLVTIPAGQGSIILPLAITDDAVVEDDETVTLTPGIITSNYGAFTIDPASVFTLTIADNDIALLTLTGPATITEGNTGTQNATFTLTLNKGTSTSFDINYTTADGTALAGEDYVAVSDVLHFAGNAGENYPITVQINGDKKIEQNELLQILLSGLTNTFNNRLSIAQAATNLTIVNNDAATITITPANGAEGGVDASFTFSFTDPDATSDVPITISYGLNGTAVSTGTDFDYTASPTIGTITIPANTKSVTLNLAVNDDQFVEGSETVILTTNAVAPLNYGVTIANSPQTLTIADNDVATLQISNATVTEGDNATRSITFDVKLDNATGVPFTVAYATANGTATAVEDYTAKTGTLNFAGTANEIQTITILVNGDQKIERDETFTVTLGTLSSTFSNRLTISTGTATGTIVNDDAGLITITKTDGAEGGTNGGYLFSLPAGITLDAPVTISYTLGGTAFGNGADYTASPSVNTITIAAGQNNVALQLAVTNDQTVEFDETVELQNIVISSVYGSMVTLDPVVPVVTIADNDVAQLTVTGPATFIEGNTGTQTATFTVTLNRATSASFDVDYTTADGTAKTSDNDYVQASGSLHFAGNAGESHQISVVINGDKKIEQNEIFNLLLSSLSQNFNNRLTLPATAPVISITNDDTGTLVIVPENGAEGTADAAFTFSFTDPDMTADVPLTISYGLGGTASSTGANIDFTATPAVGTITLPANTKSIRLNLAVTDDQLVEGTETVILTTNIPGGLPYGITVSNSPQQLSITDNDVATLTVANVSVAEGNSGVQNLIFTVKLDQPTTTPFTVSYSTADGTALNGEDYTARTGVLNFNGTANEAQTVTIQVKGDQKIEPNEIFTLTLGSLSQNFSGRLTIPFPTATGTILDDDNASITLTRVSDGAEPNTNARFKISIIDAGIISTQPVQIFYSISGTAVNGLDYQTLSGNLTVPAGANEAFIDVEVNDDILVESDETVIVQLTSASNSSVTFPVQNTPVTVKIADNDAMLLVVSNPTIVEGNQGSTNLTFDVRLSSKAPSSFSVQYRTVDGTATAADNDYTPVSGTWNFTGAEGETQSVSVAINGDKKIERTEKFTLALIISDTFNGKLTVLDAPATATIVDDDDLVNNKQINVTVTDGAEGGLNGSITLSLPAGITMDAPVSIPFIMGGSALTAVDYAPLFVSPLIIPAGTNSITLSVPVRDDLVMEGTETIQFIPGVITNSRYTGVAINTLVPVMNILDNDYGMLTVSNPTIREGHNNGALLKFDVTLSMAAKTGFTIDYSTTDGTATLSDNDYNLTVGSLAFIGTAGETRSVSVLVNGDIAIEPNETLSLILSELSNTMGGHLSISTFPGAGTIVNDDIEPVAADDAITTDEDTPVTFTVTGNDTDTDGAIDPASVLVITQPLHGTLTMNASGSFTYVPELNYNGKDSFTYTVKDNTGIPSKEAKVTILINAGNDKPDAVDDSYYVLRDGSFTGKVSVNDTDLDGDHLICTVATNPANGRITSFDPGTGTFTYAPNKGFTGIDKFTYRACDAGGLCDIAEVTLYVQPLVTINLSPATKTIVEGESVTITASITEPLFQDVVITFNYSGTANVVTDYTLDGDFASMTIPAGALTTTQQITLGTIKDQLKEGVELALVSIKDAGPVGFVTIGTSAAISITDFYPQDQEIDKDANADINPDPLMSPNGDGVGNERFLIYNIEKYPDNEVSIFNRWGNEVFRIKGYDNRDKSFNGFANTGFAVNASTAMVDGVYYYVVRTKDAAGAPKTNRGFFIIKR